VTLDRTELLWDLEGHQYRVGISTHNPLSITPGILWSKLCFRTNEGEIKCVDGLRNQAAVQLAKRIDQIVADRQRVVEIDAFEHQIRSVLSWHKRLTEQWLDLSKQGRWISGEQWRQLDTEAPHPASTLEHLAAMIQEPLVQEHLGQNSQALKAAIARSRETLQPLVNKHNEQIMINETARLTDRDRDGHRLTDEQARAITLPALVRPSPWLRKRATPSKHNGSLQSGS